MTEGPDAPHGGRRMTARVRGLGDSVQLPDEWREAVVAWAQENGNVAELWLFGSRAKGLARPDSDLDLAVQLMPPNGNHDWAFGNYMALGDRWQADLAAIVGRHVSLQAFGPGMEEVRETAILLWKRAA